MKENIISNGQFRVSQRHYSNSAVYFQNIRCIAMSKTAYGEDKMDWYKICALLYNVFISLVLKKYVYKSNANNNHMPTQYTEKALKDIRPF